MGIRHKECFVEGIQFNPGSILTKDGSLIIGNVLKEAGKK
jgi:anthranilate/para-aminobenzoate synthase component II